MTNNEFEKRIKETDEWNRKQYIPGSYIGGNLPPYLKYGRKSILSTIILSVVIISAVLILISYFA